MRIYLTSKQMKFSEEVAIERQRLAEFNGRQDAYKLRTKNPLQNHLEGANAELAVSLLFNMEDEWTPVWEDICPGRADIGEYIDVRSTKYKNGNLILHKKDADDHVFVLVCGEAPDLSVPGMILGSNGKQEKYWGDRGKNRPCYWIPQEDLIQI